MQYANIYLKTNLDFPTQTIIYNSSTSHDKWLVIGLPKKPKLGIRFENCVLLYQLEETPKGGKDGVDFLCVYI